MAHIDIEVDMLDDLFPIDPDATWASFELVRIDHFDGSVVSVRSLGFGHNHLHDHIHGFEDVCYELWVDGEWFGTLLIADVVIEHHEEVVIEFVRLADGRIVTLVDGFVHIVHFDPALLKPMANG